MYEYNFPVLSQISFDFIYFLQSNQVTSVSVYTCKLLRVNVTKHYQLNYGVNFASR